MRPVRWRDPPSAGAKGEVMNCTRCHDEKMITRFGELCGLCLLCIENDVIGMRATISLMKEENARLRERLDRYQREGVS